MKRYERIYISDDEEELFQEIFGPVIVLSLEELREMWDHCAVCQVDKETDHVNTFNFKTYLQSKGIELP